MIVDLAPPEPLSAMGQLVVPPLVLHPYHSLPTIHTFTVWKAVAAEVGDPLLRDNVTACGSGQDISQPYQNTWLMP